jgi:hypothetical protein
VIVATPLGWSTRASSRSAASNSATVSKWSSVEFDDADGQPAGRFQRAEEPFPAHRFIKEIGLQQAAGPGRRPPLDQAKILRALALGQYLVEVVIDRPHGVETHPATSESRQQCHDCGPFLAAKLTERRERT